MTPGPRSSACRPATCIPEHSTRSLRSPRLPTNTRPGCTSTERSGSGRRPRRRLRSLVTGLETADSWATDAHKTLNVPYDCGVSVVAYPEAVRAAMGVRGAYLLRHATEPDPFDTVPEMSRRARGVPVWAALRSLGRSGVAALVDRLVGNAQALAAGISQIDGTEVLNDVVYTQVCVSFGADSRTEAVARELIADGAVWMSGSRWRDRAVLRISVSNWSTDDQDVETSLDAVRRAVAAVDHK